MDGIGLGKKCKPDRFFITDVIEKLTSRAYVVVGDSVIEEISQVKHEDDEDDEQDSNSGVIIRAGDVLRFGRVCYLIKETSIDLEKRAITDISQK